MKLGAIRDYLKQHGQASVLDIATHFDIAIDTAQFALQYWEQKGQVRVQSAGCGSTGCSSGCSQTGAQLQRYEWVKRAVPLRFLPLR